MTRRITGLCVAGAFAFAISAAAQTTTTDQRSRMSDNAAGHAVTVTGCLTKSGDGNFMLTNARMDTTGTSTTTSSAATGTTATGGTTVGTTGTTPTNTTESANAGMGTAMTWLLQGGNDLDKHVGHKVQVSGRTTFEPSDRSRKYEDSNASAATTAAGTTTASTTGTAGTTTAGEPPTATTGTTGETPQRNATTTDKGTRAANQPRLDVQSVKMIASNCQ